MPNPSHIQSPSKQFTRSACSRSLLARKANEKLQMIEISECVEDYFPRHRQ